MGVARNQTPPNRLESGLSMARDTWHKYRYSAKKRNKAFSLSLAQFIEMTSQNCYLCGKPPLQKASKKGYFGTYFYNGLDRIDNKEGYVIGNVLACCQACNFLKRDKPLNEFLEIVEAIAKYQWEVK